MSITGGNIDGTVIGGTTTAAGSFTTLNASGQITSTVATGTAPLVIASTDLVTNLNADLLDGLSSAAFLQASNNLSDLASISTARTNLGLGTLATQDASSVSITGGNIDGTVIGGTTTAAGSFTTLNASGQITSTVATGTAPLVIASTDLVTNLNADLLDGLSSAAFLQASNNPSDLASISTARTNLGLGTLATQDASSVSITGGNIDGTVIGGTTTAAGSFTTLNASGQITLHGCNRHSAVGHRQH
ncbi:MAG: hypothetical protein IPP14_15245 [Planctomycetes bacterium]|nr:hypothetical protein [Planctomycetota bacterium]